MSNDQKIALVTGGSRGPEKIWPGAWYWCVILTYRTKESEALEPQKEIESMGRKRRGIKTWHGWFLITGWIHVRPQVCFTPKWNTAILTTWSIMQVGLRYLSRWRKNSSMNSSMYILKARISFTQKCVPIINEGGRIINISTGTTRMSNPGYPYMLHERSHYWSLY